MFFLLSFFFFFISSTSESGIFLELLLEYKDKYYTRPYIYVLDTVYGRRVSQMYYSYITIFFF